MAEHAIVTRNLTKPVFGKTTAVEGLDLEVPAGSVCGFLGRYGSGKTDDHPYADEPVEADCRHC